MKLIFFIVCFALALARPQRPMQREGEVRNFKGQKKFSFDNTKLKRDEFMRTGNKDHFSQEPIFKYDIELADNYHSLDDEEQIEEVDCTPFAVEIFSTEKLNDWKIGDVFTGSEMWKCQYNLMRKVISIELEGKEQGLYHYYMKTVDAEMKDIFKKADVDYHLPTIDDFEEEIKQQEKQRLKTASYAVEFISPNAETVVDSEVGLEVAFSLTGCTVDECGEVTMKAMIYANDKVWPIADTLRTQYVGVCSSTTDYNCRFLIPMKDDGYGYDEKGYVKFEFYKNGAKFLEKEIEILTNDVKFIYELPLKGTVMSMDEALNVTWDVTSATLRKHETLDLKIWKKVDWWFDALVQTVTVKTADKKLSYVLKESNGFEKGTTYYIVVEPGNGEKYESFPFTISDGSDSIQLVTPDCTTFISKGDQLTVGWEYKNPLSSNKLKVKMVRSISFWPDETVYNNENVDITETELTIDVGSMTPSTKYFIVIEYEAEGKKHYAYSDFFTYSYAKIFTVSSTSTNEKSRMITINMKVNQYIGKYYVSVHQKFPVFSMLDYEIEGTQQKEITEYNVGQSYTQSFSYTQGTPFRAYVQFRYRCLYKDHLCDEEKYYIDDVPYEESIFEWNYNSLTHSVKDPSLDIVQYDCSNGVNTENVGTSFTDICNRIPNFDFEFSTTCENCYVFAPLKAFGFELLINAGYAYKAKLNLEADLEMSLGVLSTFRGEYHFNYDTQLTDLLSFKIRIPLGPVLVTIQPGMQFFFGFDFDTVIMLEAQASFYKAYTILFSFDSTKESLKDQFKVTAADITPDSQVSASINGNVDINVKPVIIADFMLDCKCYGVPFIQGDMEMKLGVDMDIFAQYPAFPVDGIYSSDYPYYIKMDLSFFALMNYQVTIFDNVLTEKSDFDLLDTNYKYKFAFLKAETETSAVSLSLPIKASYGELSGLEHSTLKYEIGKLAKALGSKKFAVTGINEYLVNGEKDDVRSTGDVLYYNYHAFDSKMSYDIMYDVKNCLTGGSCAVKLDPLEYPSMNKIKDFILPCQKTECTICSLDETVCA